MNLTEKQVELLRALLDGKTVHYMRKTLRGDRNQCPCCEKYFNSSFAFDKHRTGRFGVDRRCMSTEEMNAAGMSEGSDGFWVSSKMPAEAVAG